MGIVGKQLGQPSGVLGGLAGKFMANNNADLNRWIATQAVAESAPSSILEVGSGPGLGTEALLAAAPHAQVTALDPSAPMQRQLARRNRSAIANGRLSTVTRTLRQLDSSETFDLVVAVHVLYFWSTPHEELIRIREMLRPGGLVALGYQLRDHMPAVAQRDFPTVGHQLYATDDQVLPIVLAAELDPKPVRVLGDPDRPLGRLLLATQCS